MSTTTNGRATRKSLAEQIDRLDTILDGLADALNQSVAQVVQAAVEVAVREAVRGVLIEIVSNPEVLDRLRTHLAPASVDMPAPTPVISGEPQKVGLRKWVSAGIRAAGQLATAARDRIRSSVAEVGACIDMLRPYRRPLFLATGIGVVVAILAYLAAPWLAALASGVGAFATTLTVQAGRWLNRTLGSLPSDA